MRSDWTRESPYMVINYGPYGGGHSHADMLSFELFAYGQALAVDAGIGVSYDDPLHRPWYVTSMAHNMLVFDGENLDRRGAVGQKPLWSTQDGLDYFSAEHEGYQAQGVWHRRHFLFLKPAPSATWVSPYFLLFDAYSSATRGKQASFVLHSPTPMSKSGTTLTSTESPGLIVTTPDEVAIRQGMGMANLGGVSSPSRREIGWASLDRSTEGRGSVESLPVVLFPYQSESTPAVTLRRGQNSGPAGTAYLRIEHLGIVDHVVISDGQLRTYGDGTIETDARCALIRTRPDGEALSYAAVSATQLTYEGNRVMTSSRPTDGSGPVVP